MRGSPQDFVFDTLAAFIKVSLWIIAVLFLFWLALEISYFLGIAS